MGFLDSLFEVLLVFTAFGIAADLEMDGQAERVVARGRRSDIDVGDALDVAGQLDLLLTCGQVQGG